MTCQHRTVAVLALTVILATATACQGQTTGATGTAVGAPVFTPLPAFTGTGACTADYGPDNTGLTVNGSDITGAVSVGCFPQPDGIYIYAALVHTSPNTGKTTVPASNTYTSTQDQLSITAHCAPGLWILVANITTAVNGVATTTSTYGQEIQVTAADCAD